MNWKFVCDVSLQTKKEVQGVRACCKTFQSNPK